MQNHNSNFKDGHRSPPYRLSEDELKSIDLSWQKLPLHIQYYRDLVRDSLLDLSAIKIEIDGNEGIDVTVKKQIKHHLAMEHFGFLAEQIEEFVCVPRPYQHSTSHGRTSAKNNQ